jgi:hypothetical protein
MKQKRLNEYEKLFLANQQVLPESSNTRNPKMEYHALADGFFWTDEGLTEIDWELSHAFRYVIHYRTSLITNSNKSNELCYQVYELAKKHFPNWVGFQKNRCTQNEELAARIERIRKVSKWRIDKSLNELENKSA